MIKIIVNLVVLTLLVSIALAIEVKTSSGTVRGNTVQVLNRTVNEFLGIPFAEPPIGELRFAKPKPIEKPLPGVIDATKFKNSCWQNTYPGQQITVDEDCLFLNIWTQTASNHSSTLKPVMFWIYGGALMGGSIFDKNFNGSVLATHDVVLVATNYRLGAFGFLYGNDSTAPGNVGFFDQNLALKWVRDNIHLFGGDKNQITLFGQSAGSWSVSSHLISPHSKGLFKRAIMQSGSIMYIKSDQGHLPQKALDNAIKYAKRFNCTDENKWLQCMRKVDARLMGSNLTGQVVLESEFLPFTAQEAFEQVQFNKDLDIIAGNCRDEGSYTGIKDNTTLKDFESFVNSHRFGDMNSTEVLDYYLNGVNTSDSNALKWRLFDFNGDLQMKCPTYLFLNRYYQKSNHKNVFFYELTHTAESDDYERERGIPHSSDIAWIFGVRIVRKGEKKENVEFSKMVVKYWTDFAKYGNPGNSWPNFMDKTGKDLTKTVKILNPKEENVHNLFKQCDQFWSKYFL